MGKYGKGIIAGYLLFFWSKIVAWVLVVFILIFNDDDLIGLITDLNLIFLDFFFTCFYLDFADI